MPEPITAQNVSAARVFPRSSRPHHRRQHGHAVLVAFPGMDHDLVAREVHVLDAQAAAFEQAQPRPVEHGAAPSALGETGLLRIGEHEDAPFHDAAPG